MAKFYAPGATFKAKRGGSFKNVDVNLAGATLEFEEDGIHVSTDESVAIVEKIVESSNPTDLVALIAALKSAAPEKQEEVLRKSFLSKHIGHIKDLTPLISALIKGFSE